MGPPVGEHAGVDGALIEDGVRVHNAAFLIDDRIAAAMDGGDDEEVSEFELRKAVHRVDFGSGDGLSAAAGALSRRCWGSAAGALSVELPTSASRPVTFIARIPIFFFTAMGNATDSKLCPGRDVFALK